MAKKLKQYVHVVNPDTGTYEVFGPEDTLPSWAEKAITNPAAYEEVGEIEEPGSSMPSDDVPEEMRPASESSEEKPKARKG